MFKRWFGLFLTMMKIGLFTFGGGYAMIPLLENEFVVRKKWIDQETFMDMLAVAESTPGPIAINAATYIGYRVGGLVGSVCGTVGVCIPSFTIIYLISLFFDRFLEIAWVAAAFRGIRVCVAFLILTAGIRFLRKMEKTPFNLILLSATTVCMLLFSLFSIRFSTVFYVLICGAVGLLFYLIGRARKEDDGK